MIASNRPPADARPFGVVPVVRPVRWSRPWLLGAFLMVALLPITIAPRHSGNVLSRYMTIEAIVERGTLAVERTPMMKIARPVDMVRFGEHYYSDKPPVLAAIATPIYAAMVVLGVRFTGSEGQFVLDNLAITWLTVGSCSALTLVWLRRMFQTLPIPAIVADLLTLGLGFGSQLLTYAVTFNNHSVAAALITGAMALTLLERPGGQAGRDRFVVGLLAGFAAVIDLPAGCLMLTGLGLLLTIRARLAVWPFIAGAIGPLILHSWLQAKVTGTPLPVEMYPEAFVYPGSFWLTPEGTFQEYGARHWFGLELLFGPPGWLTLTPVLAFGLAGLAMVLARRGDPLRPMAALIASSLVILIVYYTWVVRRTDFAGQSFGVRHLLAITPAVYFFAVVAMSRLRGWTAPSLFVVLIGIGFFYAYHGVKDPWARIEEREFKEPTLQAAQRWVIYPWSRTRHKFELERAKSSPNPNPVEGSAMIGSAPVWAKVVLVVILALDTWWRCHTVGPSVRDRLGFAPWPVVVGEAEPLDCDEAAYGYIGRKLDGGSVMYRDVSENKPPIGYWLYAIAEAIGGANEWTIRVMPIPFVLATIVLVWWLGLRIRGPGAGCLAAFLFAVLSTDPFLYGNGANMEHFINLFAVASLAAMVRSFASPGRRWLIVAGVLVGVASLIKQVAALHGPVYALAIVLIDRGDPTGQTLARRLKSRVADLVALAIGFGSAWGVAVVVLWLQGAGPSAFEDMVTYGSALATIKVPDAHAPSLLVRWFAGNADPEGMLPPPFGRTRYLVWWGSGSWPAWLAAAPSTAWLLLGPRGGRSRRLAAGWTLSSWVQVALPGLFWQHYYLLPTPGVAIALAVALADAVGLVGASIRPARPGRLLIGLVAGILMLAGIGGTVRLQVRDYLLVPPEELTSRFKGGRQWVVLRAMGRDLARRTRGWEGASLYVWGWQSPLFLYSGLDGPTRHFFADPLLEDYSKGYHRDDPRVRPRADRIMRDLEAHPPTIALVAYTPFPELRRFLEARYIPTRLDVLGESMPLWVAREHYGRFSATAGTPTSSTTPATAR